MPRPPKTRLVEFLPEVNYFKPASVPLCQLEEVILTVEELESIRLKDMEGLDQKEAAEKMQVSRPTYQLILSSARKKLAEALIKGKAIKIQGGTYKIIGKGKGRGKGKCKRHRKGAE